MLTILKDSFAIRRIFRRTYLRSFRIRAGNHQKRLPPMHNRPVFWRI